MYALRYPCALGLLLSLSACASRHLDPALPVERTVWADQQMVSLDDVDQGPNPMNVQAAATPKSLAEDIQNTPVSTLPVTVPSLEEWQQYEAASKPGEPQKPKEPPATTIARATALATMGPSRQHFANDQSVIQRYPYKAGVRYEVYTSPVSPTNIFLPEGERLAAPPMVNPEAWDMVLLESGEGPQYRQVIQLRPTIVGLDTTLSFFTQSGLSFFCRLRSVPQTSMVAVAWLVPKQRPVFPVPQEEAEEPKKSRFKAPQIDTSRLHLGYTLAYDTKRVPPWVPTAVWDDGQQTFIKFKEPLTYTHAPVLFGLSGKAPTPVQYTPYVVPGQPEKGAYYVAVGLHPILSLKGTDGYEVQIVRQPGQPKAWQPMAQQ